MTEQALAARIQAADMPLDLKSQRVDYRKNGKRKRNTRTVYNVRLDVDGIGILGDIRFRDPDQTHGVQFYEEGNCWRLIEGETVEQLQARAQQYGLDSVRGTDMQRLHDSHDARSIRRYAVALHAKRKYHQRLPQADKVIRCPHCDQQIVIGSPNFLYKTLKGFCPVCKENREFQTQHLTDATPESTRERRIHELEMEL